MKKYYVIHLFQDLKNKGYIVNSDKGLVMVPASELQHIAKFDNTAAAKKFMVSQKLNKNNKYKKSIKSSFDLMKDPDYPTIELETAYYITNAAGHKICVNEKMIFFLKKCDTNFAIWKDKTKCGTDMLQLEEALKEPLILETLNAKTMAKTKTKKIAKEAKYQAAE